MTIRIDLHVHSKVSKSIPFRMEYFRNTVSQARKVGLQGFALTEHIHALGYWESMRTLASRFAYTDGRMQLPGGFTVLAGAELTVADRADVIAIGKFEHLEWLDRQFTPRLSEGCFPRLAELLPKARQANLMLIGAHATRPGKRLVDVGDELLGQLDALEINGKDMAHGPANLAINEIAGRLDLPVFGSSDAHNWSQAGVQRSLVPLAELSLGGLWECAQARSINTETDPNISTIVKISKTHKRIMKARIAAQRSNSSHQEFGFPEVTHTNIGWAPQSHLIQAGA